MKRIFTLFISLCSLAVMGQYPVSSINITMPAKPAANMADWATGGTPLIITAQAKLVQGQVPGNLMESRILVTIKSGDRKICGSFTQQTAPYSTFNAATKTWSGAAALRLLGGNCILKPGSYELCVQFFSSYAPITPFSNEVCKSFTIADNKQLTYSPPQLVMPANGKNFTQQEIKQPIQLRWTPVVPPPPNNDVIYTVRIYEVKQGQQPAQAVKTTAPVFEKEVRTTQTIWQMPGKYASSKENKTFVWSIQAHNAEDRTLIEGGGRVELFSFGLKSVMTPWMSVYVNDQLGNQTLDSCHFTFSFNHPGGAGNFHLKLLDATLNNLTCEDNTSLQICAITPVMEFATTNASLNIDYDNNTGIAIIDHDENNQITGLSRLICGHNYLVIVCSDEGGDLGGGIYHSCASFLFNCCTPPPAKCACKGWDPIIVTVNGVKHTVACGGTIHVPLNTTYSISTDLLCTGKNCVKQLDGKIIYPNGTTVPYNFGSGAALIGPMSSTIPQNLQMCFNGTCNNYTSCLPCCINIIVDSSAIPNCKCKGWKTNTGTYNDIATVFTHDFKCGGGTYTLNAGMIYNFNSPVYLCDLAGCNPTYKWKVDGVLQGTGTSFSYTAVAG
ncbi:MAG: hypothetical protein JWN83_2038, partial [Chitinophagaceae bacterium]|nr:hypothetical protein [Chitinophagaceae bacterium]